MRVLMHQESDNDISFSFLKDFKWVRVENIGNRKILRLMMPITGCFEGVSTDNTCKTISGLKEFFGSVGSEVNSAEVELKLFKVKIKALGEEKEKIKATAEEDYQNLVLTNFLTQADNLLKDLEEFKKQNPNFLLNLEIPHKIQEFIFAEKSFDESLALRRRVIGEPNFYAIHLRPRVIDSVLGILDPNPSNRKPTHLRANFRFNRNTRYGAANDFQYWQIQPDSFAKNLMLSFIGDDQGSNRLYVVKKTRKIEASQLFNELSNLITDSNEDPLLNPTFRDSRNKESLRENKLSTIYDFNTNITDLFGINLDDSLRRDYQKNNLILLHKALIEFFDQKFGIPSSLFSLDKLKEVIANNKDNIAEIPDLFIYVCSEIVTLNSQRMQQDQDISPFYTVNIEQKDQNNHGRNKLAIIAQFFIAKFNHFCIANELCSRDLDLANILDENPEISDALVQIIKTNLENGDENIEKNIVNFLSCSQYGGIPAIGEFTTLLQTKLEQEFKMQWSAISESDHFDDFMFVSPKQNGRVIYNKASGYMQIDFSAFQAFHIGKERLHYQPDSYCLSSVRDGLEDQERFSNKSLIHIDKVELTRYIQNLLKSPTKENLIKVVDCLLRKITDEKSLFELEGFEFDNFLEFRYCNKQQIKKLLKIVAKKIIKDDSLEKFLKYIDSGNHELSFTKKELRALYVAISGRKYGNKNLILNNIKGYQNPEDIAKIIAIALAMKDSEEKYMAQIKSRFGSLSLDTKTANSVAQSFGGVILSKDLMVFSPKDISIDEFGNARITVDPESVAVSNIKDKLDQLTNKFKKIFYLASGSSVRDEDNLAKILFENANLIYGQKTSASENSEEWSTPDSLIEYYKDKGINITHYEIHQYRVRRALEIIGINRVGIIERISYAGNSGYLIQLPDECYDFLDSWFFSNRIDIAKSVKIYQLVCYLCPEQTYKEMMQLTNAGMDGPKKFEFALKALGIPFSNLKNFESDGFTVIIDKEFLDFIDKIPNLKRQVLSLFGKDLECIHKAFEKRFADKPEIIEQTRFLRDKPNCDRIKFILAKLGIPYHNLKFDENSRQIDLEIPETLLTDLSSYLRIEVPPSSEIKLTCYDQKITEFGLFRKINYLHERLVFNELNAKRLNIKELDERVQEVTTPQKQVKISKVLAYKKKTLQSASSTQLRCAVICPKHILEEFRNLMSQTQVLGTIIKDPYSDKEIKIPQIADDLQPWHMQLLARNEQVNVTGIFNFDLYQGLMTDDQVVRLRCLAKSTTLIGIDEVKETGGYEQPKITLDQPRKIIVIDQVGFQWQWDHRNSGCLFFYPNQNANLESIVGGIEELQKFQKDMYQAIYGIQRPESPSDFAGDNIEVKWLDVEGRLYLKGVSFGIKEEFLQALYSAIHASEFVDPHEKILFRFLKNGIGYFKKGLLEKNSDQLSDINQYKLENARLEGILDAVMELDKNLPDNLVVRKNFFKKVSALQLPFSNIWEESLDDRKAKKIKKDEGKVSEEIDELKSIALSYVESIKATLEKLGIEYRGDKKIDACMPEDGFVVATTSNGNPHALFGNEGGYQSVGASIASNLTNPEKFQLISENFSQVERNIITEKFELKSQINQGEDSDLGSSFVPASLVNISNQTRSSQPSSAVQASSTQSFPSFDNKASCVNCRQS